MTVLNNIPVSPTTAAADRCVRLRECTLDDHGKVTELTQRHGIRTEPYVQWAHLWLSNPAYRNATGKWPMGWVIEDGDQIVGYLGNIPQEYMFRGRALLAATSRSWVVDHTHRGYGPMLLDMHFTQPGVDLFVHPTVNANASAAYATFDALPVPVGEWNRSAFWITGHVGVVRSRLRMKGVPFAAALTRPIATVSYLKDKVTCRRFRPSKSISLEQCTMFDERFEVFWHELQAQNPNALLAVRTREALQWHYHYALSEGRASVVVVSQRNRIIGYAIFFRNDNRKIALRRLRLVDFQALNDWKDILLASLSWALQKCRREKIHMLENVGLRPAGTTIIEELAPHTRALPNWLYFYKARDAALSKQLADSSVWSPCGFDGDASL